MMKLYHFAYLNGVTYGDFSCDFLAFFLRESNLTLQDYDELYMQFGDDEDAHSSAFLS